MDRGEHAVQFPALINTMQNDDGNWAEVVFRPERDISVPSALKADRAMEMSPVPGRAHEAVGDPRLTNLRSCEFGWIETGNASVERAWDG
ncbi:hypothetical protein [Methylobacterium sp. 391_Methyba4]|uniref:hypothetical protein n=1 Tax=Methylobacterium sp. 391_Methyba4 TaxID=3038924 RepID=UPI00241FFB08|nr:hypothetical protein [Methylobacterium sp. 391_Methyba4]WFS09684.1 hypothetical protein P9K36_10565 [Methylobacterium sp. 391_Methyba4]